MARDHLIFDLDGTISDPAVGIGRSINFALTSFGYPEISEGHVSQYIGPPIDDIFRALTGTGSDQHVLDLVGKFRERYADVGYSENVLYPGITEALGDLWSRGVPLGLCTSKRVDFAERILTLFGLRDYFGFVSGGEVGLHKDAQLKSLIDGAVAARGSIMIGDRAVDVLAARAHGLPSAGVLWGHGSEAELRDAGADQLLELPSEIGELRHRVRSGAGPSA